MGGEKSTHDKKFRKDRLIALIRANPDLTVRQLMERTGYGDKTILNTKREVEVEANYEAD